MCTFSPSLKRTSPLLHRKRERERERGIVCKNGLSVCRSLRWGPRTRRSQRLEPQKERERANQINRRRNCTPEPFLFSLANPRLHRHQRIINQVYTERERASLCVGQTQSNEIQSQTYLSSSVVLLLPFWVISAMSAKAEEEEVCCTPSNGHFRNTCN